MTNFIKLMSASAIAVALTACVSTYDEKPANDAMVKSESTMMKDDVMVKSESTMMKDDAMMKDGMAKKDSMMKEAMMEDAPMVGGAAMLPSKTIVENASAASNLTTLVSAVAQAQLVETLSGPGPFTVFAPTNDAFALLPAATVNTLMMDENRADLQKVLTAHVVPGTISAADLIAKINATTGTYTAETVSGDTLSFYLINGEVKVADENGTLATVTTADVFQSNGVVHVVNSVLVPK